MVGCQLLRAERNRQFRLHRVQPGSECGARCCTLHTVHHPDITFDSHYLRAQHVFLRACLPPGRYVCLPTTFQPGTEATFLLRLFRWAAVRDGGW